MEMKELTLEKFEESVGDLKKVTQETKLVFSEYFSQASRETRYTSNRKICSGPALIRSGGLTIRSASFVQRKKGEGADYRICRKPCPGRSLCGQAGRCKGHSGDAGDDPSDQGEPDKSLGADVVLSGNVFDEACAHAYELAEEHGYTFVHPFNDLQIATGQGTIAMEIIKELPTVDYILVPIGGGGLCTGVSTLAKLLNPKIKVIAVEPAGAACIKVSPGSRKVVGSPGQHHCGRHGGTNARRNLLFPISRKMWMSIITIEDSELTLSFLDMAENHKMFVENSGLFNGGCLKASDLQGKRRLSLF